MVLYAFRVTNSPLRRSWTHHMQGTRGVSSRLPNLANFVC